MRLCIKLNHKSKLIIKTALTATSLKLNQTHVVYKSQSSAMAYIKAIG
jgi:hypothetical protein